MDNTECKQFLNQHWSIHPVVARMNERWCLCGCGWCGDVGARVSIMSPVELTLDMGHVNSLVSVTTNIGTDHKLHLQITHSQHHFHEKKSVLNVIQHLFLSESLCKSLLIIATRLWQLRRSGWLFLVVVTWTSLWLLWCLLLGSWLHLSGDKMTLLVAGVTLVLLSTTHLEMSWVSVSCSQPVCCCWCNPWAVLLFGSQSKICPATKSAGVANDVSKQNLFVSHQPPHLHAAGPCKKHEECTRNEDNYLYHKLLFMFMDAYIWQIRPVVGEAEDEI